MTANVSRPILRDPGAPNHGRVFFAELFFDLVFVFAVTQLSHGLLEHLSIEGALQTGFLLLAVWTVWMWTTWVTNWLNTAAHPVRLMLFALMGVGLVMSVSIPEAFAERGIYFAVAYVLIHNARNLFTIWALGRGDPVLRRTFVRMQVYFVISAAFWIAGGLAENEARWALWLIGLGLDLSGPWWRYWTPGLGRAQTADWHVDAHHMAERCGLFVILSLGESIIILGATFAGGDWTWTDKAAFGIGFVSAVAMWWVYFATAAGAAARRFARHDDPGRIARAAYTYAHIPLVAGIILTAVADELVLARPAGQVDVPMLAAALGGPALFLLGGALFSRMVCGGFPISHLVGLAMLALGLPLAEHVSPLALTTETTGVLVLAGAWETFAPTNRDATAR